MDDAMSLLLDLPGLWVVSCEGMPPDGRRVVVMQRAAEHGCPRCRVLVGGKPSELRESRSKDLPVGHRPLAVVWRKRRYRCPETALRVAGVPGAVGAGAAPASAHRAAAGQAGEVGVWLVPCAV